MGDRDRDISPPRRGAQASKPSSRWGGEEGTSSGGTAEASSGLRNFPSNQGDHARRRSDSRDHPQKSVHRRSRSRSREYRDRRDGRGRSPSGGRSRSRSAERRRAVRRDDDRDRDRQYDRDGRRNINRDSRERDNRSRFDTGPRDRREEGPTKTLPSATSAPVGRYPITEQTTAAATTVRNSRAGDHHHAIDISPPRRAGPASPASSPPRPIAPPLPPLPPLPASAPLPPLPEELPKEPEKPNFGLSGALAKDKTTGNVYNGITLKWSEPPEAALPGKHWRLYVFKDGELLDKPLHIHRSSAFLFGRERKVADIPIDHPSCSSQHAVLQYRLVTLPSANPADPPRRVVRPYIMDLESTNGTFVNGTRIEPARYFELREKDLLKFGLSSREYILMTEESAK